MPHFERDTDTGPVRLNFEESGSGFPVLLIAPGGMRSTISFWRGMAWDPIVELADRYRVIAMDQRNAGSSTAPVTGNDSWATYTADQLALMEHLGAEKFHVMGMCIGGPYAMGLIEAAPERVSSAVLFQSIGLMADQANRGAFHEMFDGWADALKPTMNVSEADWQSFRSNMYDSNEFLFNVGDDFVRNNQTPLCVLEGNDLYHPQETSQKIAQLSNVVHYIERWKEDADRGAAMSQVTEFLARHTPA